LHPHILLRLHLPHPHLSEEADALGRARRESQTVKGCHVSPLKEEIPAQPGIIVTVD